MTDLYHGPRWHRIEHRRRFDAAVLGALGVAMVSTDRLTGKRRVREHVMSWRVVDVLKRSAVDGERGQGSAPTSGNVVTAATKLPAGATVSARSVGESLKRLAKAGQVERIELIRTYKTRPPRLLPYPGWRPK